MSRLSAEEARSLARRALIAAGATMAVADAVSWHAIEAEFAGHPSHGLRLIPVYCAGSEDPGVDLAAEPRVVSHNGALTTIDAGRGLGHLAMAMAVDCAAASARAHGVGAAGVVQCGHAGRAGAWAERGAEHGCATMVVLGGSAPPFVMSARPGAAPSLHTNPIAFAVPASGHPLMLDMATSMVAEGKVHVALSRHLALPEGSILSADGRVSNDAGDFASGGCLLPVGGHKGFGLSAIVEALGVKLTGADAAGREPLEGGLVVCVSSGAFRPAEEVAAAVDSMRSRIRASGKTVAVLAPGDPEAQHRATAAGEVELEDELMIRLRALAATARPGKEPSA